MNEIYQLYINYLREAVKIKSISTTSEYQKEIGEMVLLCEKLLNDSNFEVKTISGYGNPIVFGNLNIDSEYETVLLYGHYDVQPAEESDGWIHDPFDLKITDDKLYGRGAIDNKGQFLIYLAIINHLIRDNSLKYNIKIILEGNEESGSEELINFLRDYRKDLDCDFAMCSDGEIQNNQPTIDVSFRGNINSTLKIIGPKNDLHSGLYGGLVENPIQVLSNFICSIASENGLLKNLDLNSNIDSIHLNNIADMKFNQDDFRLNTGLDRTSAEGAELEVVGLKNNIQVTGINGGYTNEGYKNAVPTYAVAKINLRLAPDLYADKVAPILESYVAKYFENSYIKDYDFEVDQLANGIILDTSNKYHSEIAQILTEVYEKDVYYNYCGGTLPIAHDIVQTLGVPFIMAGLANNDCNMHGVDENFDIELVNKGLKFIYEVLKK